MVTFRTAAACLLGLLLTTCSAEPAAHAFSDDIRLSVEGAPAMHCQYNVKRQLVTVLSGTVPTWLNGSYFHAAFSTNLTGARGHKAAGCGAVVAVHFEAGEAIPKASFDFVKGSAYKLACTPLKATDKSQAPLQYSTSGSVTINAGCGQGNICSVSGDFPYTAMNGDNLDTVGAPEAGLIRAMGKKQNSFGPGDVGPPFFASSHMPTDATGEAYETLYIYEPTPGYRIFRTSPVNGSVREVLPDLSVTPQTGDATGYPSYNHQGMMFTKSFIIFPEMPLRMGKGTFDWKGIASSWLPGGQLYYRVLDKATGKPLGRYSLPPHFTWHNINAFENETHITIDTQLQQDQNALNPFVSTINVTAWKSKLVRVVLPNPRADGAAAEAAAQFTALNSTTSTSFEFGVVNPHYMWKAPTRYIFGSQTDAEHADDPWYPYIARVDVEAAIAGDTDSKVLKYAPGVEWMMAPPMFVPASEMQPASSAAGAVLVLAVSTTDGSPQMHIIDGETMELVAKLALPISGLQDMGLHNHFSAYPTSA